MLVRKMIRRVGGEGERGSEGSSAGARVVLLELLMCKSGGGEGGETKPIPGMREWGGAQGRLGEGAQGRMGGKEEAERSATLLVYTYIDHGYMHMT